MTLVMLSKVYPLSCATEDDRSNYSQDLSGTSSRYIRPSNINTDTLPRGKLVVIFKNLIGLIRWKQAAKANVKKRKVGPRWTPRRSNSQRG